MFTSTRCSRAFGYFDELELLTKA